MANAPREPLPATEQEAGLTLEIARVVTVATSDGQRVAVSHRTHQQRMLCKLGCLERAKSGRAQGGSNRAKSRLQVTQQRFKVSRS